MKAKLDCMHYSFLSTILVEMLMSINILLIHSPPVHIVVSKATLVCTAAYMLLNASYYQFRPVSSKTSIQLQQNSIRLSIFSTQDMINIMLKYSGGWQLAIGLNIVLHHIIRGRYRISLEAWVYIKPILCCALSYQASLQFKFN